MATELIRQQANPCTLYELEDTLEAFANTIDLVEAEADRRLILDEIGQALRRTKEKRDAVVAFLRHCEMLQKFADAEIERIQKKKALISRVQEQLEHHVVQVVDEFAVPDRRGLKRLEGNVSSMRIQKNPDSILITDLDAIPLGFKQALLAMPAHVWEALLERLSLEDRKVFESRVEKLEYKADKKAIAAELKNGVPIAGADLKFGEFRLVIS
jgi:Siphovirus Gp157